MNYTLNNFYISAIISGIILIILLYILFRKPTLYYKPLPLKYTTQTTDFNTLKKITQERVQNIKQKSNIFTPYNEKNMNASTNAINNSKTYTELATAFLTLPNHSIDTYPIYPIKDINKTLTFQYEQGVLGWYWGYAVYKKDNNFGTVMYYVLRNDLGTEELRKKYNLSIGETTVYTVSIGVGTGNGNWYFCPEPIICAGKYQVDNTNFTLTCKTDKLQNFVLVNTDDKLSLSFSYKDKLLDFGTNTNFIKTNKPRFNAPNGGCAPCISGVGSLYWSYTELESTSTVFIKDKKYNFTNGDGWLDHQWGRSEIPFTLVDRLGFNVINMFKPTGKLGRYVWINLHLPDNTQYMVFCFPDDNKDAEVGDNYTSKYNLYTKDESKLLQSGTISFDYITSYSYNNSSIKFPTKLTIVVYDNNNNKHTYKIDTSKYGDCITIDGSGNPHWSGGAILLEDGEEKGTAFLELNQFEEKQKYLENTLKLANINPKDYTLTKLSLWKTLPSILILLLPIILVIIIIVLIILGVKNKTN